MVGPMLARANANSRSIGRGVPAFLETDFFDGLRGPSGVVGSKPARGPYELSLTGVTVLEPPTFGFAALAIAGLGLAIGVNPTDWRCTLQHGHARARVSFLNSGMSMLCNKPAIVRRLR